MYSRNPHLFRLVNPSFSETLPPPNDRPHPQRPHRCITGILYRANRCRPTQRKSHRQRNRFRSHQAPPQRPPPLLHPPQHPRQHSRIKPLPSRITSRHRSHHYHPLTRHHLRTLSLPRHGKRRRQTVIRRRRRITKLRLPRCPPPHVTLRRQRTTRHHVPSQPRSRTRHVHNRRHDLYR